MDEETLAEYQRVARALPEGAEYRRIITALVAEVRKQRLALENAKDAVNTLLGGRNSGT